jgi:hypothetical protein
MTTPTKPTNWLTLVGSLLVFFGGYLHLARGPAVNEAQRWFRIGLVAGGATIITIEASRRLFRGSSRNRE